MPGAHDERSFEDAIEASLVEDGGYTAGAAAHYDPVRGIDGDELFAFIGATEIDAWNKLIGLHGDQNTAQRRGFGIDVVHPNASAADDAQARSAVQQVAGDLSGATHDQRVGVGQQIRKFRRGWRKHGPAGFAQQFQSARSNFVCDHNSHAVFRLGCAAFPVKWQP